jgi:cytoskeletal protein CcmA (bactofilin family)
MLRRIARACVWPRFFARSAFAVSAALLLLLPHAAVVQAATERPGVHETIIADDYFGAGTAASPSGPVDGDAFIAGAQVDLNEPVNGDALLAGGAVAIAGRIGGDLYATGASVLIDGPVAGNARLAGGHVEITKRGQVFGKTTLIGGRVTVLGKAGRQLTVFGEHVTLDGEIAGNVTIASRTLSIGPNARIAGKLTYRGSMPAQADPAAVISGGINYLSFDFEDETYQPVARVVAWVGVIAFTIGLFLIGMLAIILAPQSTAHMSRLARGRPVSSLALGLVAIVCAPIAVVLLMLTIVGIPFAFMLLLGWPMILIFGYLAGVMAVSDAVAGPSAQAKGRRIFLLAMGLGVMLLFARVPFAGWCIGMLLLVMGVGAMALNAMGVTVPVRVRKEKSVARVGEPVEPAMRQEPTFRID